MEATIKHKDKDRLLISWSKDGVGFGQMEMKWNQDRGIMELDTEFMGIDFVIETFKALEDGGTTDV